MSEPESIGKLVRAINSGLDGPEIVEFAYIGSDGEMSTVVGVKLPQQIDNGDEWLWAIIRALERLARALYIRYRRRD